MYLIDIAPALLGLTRDPMMNTPSGCTSKEPVYEDFRQLIARREMLRAEKRRRTPIRLLLACFGRGIERATELLAGRLVLSLAVCLSLVLAGMSVFMMQSPHRNKTSSGVEPILPYRIAMDIVREAKGFAGDRTEANSSSHFLTKEPTSETRGTFILRVGSFRNPSNAKRVVESLRERRLNVRTEVLADGLHVVTLGPFPEKGAAEGAARSVQESIGLAPQVLRLDHE